MHSIRESPRDAKLEMRSDALNNRPLTALAGDPGRGLGNIYIYIYLLTYKLGQIVQEIRGTFVSMNK